LRSTQFAPNAASHASGAAVDVFIKTEMDQMMIKAYDDFHVGLREMKKAKNVEEF
jgi:hypothetical protein